MIFIFCLVFWFAIVCFLMQCCHIVIASLAVHVAQRFILHCRPKFVVVGSPGYFLLGEARLKTLDTFVFFCCLFSITVTAPFKHYVRPVDFKTFCWT